MRTRHAYHHAIRLKGVHNAMLVLGVDPGIAVHNPHLQMQNDRQDMRIVIQLPHKLITI